MQKSIEKLNYITMHETTIFYFFDIIYFFYKIIYNFLYYFT